MSAADCAANPLLALPFEPSIEGLGDAYWDGVEAAAFPQTRLRFRNDALLEQLGLDPAAVADRDFEAAYGRFEARQPLLALRYHGTQFGTYNPFLGDGRGFLYGQLRDIRGDLQDLGSKGSGTTPWSRGGDGRLTLKGGVREIIAAEALHRLGVSTSRTLSLVETGEELYRSDEPSPTRSSVMVRLARTHLRFGSCERLLHRREPQQLERLWRHVQATYYPQLDRLDAEDRGLALYGELVERVARLAAEWMVAGFTHGVLNTDNMSLAGESFDYGPFAFLDNWDPGFTAAYFDQTSLYAYGQQPRVCHHNLRLLQEPLAMLWPRQELEQRLGRFGSAYTAHYRSRLMRRLGFDAALLEPGGKDWLASDELPYLLLPTLQLLVDWPVAYGSFFACLERHVALAGLPAEAEALVPFVPGAPDPPRATWLAWRDVWWAWSQTWPHPETIAPSLARWNLPITPVRAEIERIWAAIDQRDDWSLLENWLEQTRGRV
jgi:uncharacterized protein YdiU (UPF0061 family)